MEQRLSPSNIYAIYGFVDFLSLNEQRSASESLILLRARFSRVSPSACRVSPLRVFSLSSKGAFLDRGPTVRLENSAFRKQLSIDGTSSMEIEQGNGEARLTDAVGRRIERQGEPGTVTKQRERLND